jgi:membrane protease YdiL (CAAX protease family)
MNAIRGAVRAYPLTTFFALALGLSWLAFIPWFGSGGDGIPWFTFGPFVAALLTSTIIGGWAEIRLVLAPIARWRVNWVWYAVAIGLPLAIQFTAVIVNPFLGSAEPAWINVPPLASVLPTVALYAVFSGPLGEEPGWRGFALPRLLATHSALTSSLLIGAIWTAWHLPLGLVGDLSHYGLLTTLLAAFAFTWLFQNTGGSVLLAILMHVSHQNSVRYLGRVYSGNDHIQQQWIGTALWAALVLVILAVYGTKSFARQNRPTQMSGDSAHASSRPRGA